MIPQESLIMAVLACAQNRMLHPCSRLCTRAAAALSLLEVTVLGPSKFDSVINLLMQPEIGLPDHCSLQSRRLQIILSCYWMF